VTLSRLHSLHLPLTQDSIGRDEAGIWDIFSVDDLVNGGAAEHRDELETIVAAARVNNLFSSGPHLALHKVCPDIRGKTYRDLPSGRGRTCSAAGEFAKQLGPAAACK
jgi:hypothetical protein